MTDDSRGEVNGLWTAKHLKPATQRNPRPQDPFHPNFI